MCLLILRSPKHSEIKKELRKALLKPLRKTVKDHHHHLGVSMAMGVPQEWWFLSVYHGKSHRNMDDDWWYPHLDENLHLSVVPTRGPSLPLFAARPLRSSAWQHRWHLKLWENAWFSMLVYPTRVGIIYVLFYPIGWIKTNTKESSSCLIRFSKLNDHVIMAPYFQSAVFCWTSDFLGSQKTPDLARHFIGFGDFWEFSHNRLIIYIVICLVRSYNISYHIFF